MQNKNHSGLFITLEGPEGSGKSTNLIFIADYLKRANIAYVQTREPGGTAIAESLRQILLNKETGVMTAETELLLMFAARVEHTEQLIKPSLSHGAWVICDRYTDSSYAYQGGGRKLGNQRVAQLEQWCLNGFKPDLTILLDVPVDTTLARIRARGSLDRIEDQGLEFFSRVRQTFLTLAADNDKRYCVINANQPLVRVQQQIAEVLEHTITRWRNSQ